MTRPVPSCYDKAIDLLSRRPHFEAELRRKLAQRKYSADEVEETLGRLRELGFLDDASAARGWVESRLRRGAIGRRRLLVELERRGVASDLAASAVAVFGEREELAAARSAARDRAQRGGSRAAIGRRLDRQGFPKHVILAVLEELTEELTEEQGEGDDPSPRAPFEDRRDQP